MAGARVFLDVGGHVGQTLEEVVKPEWRFDRIYTFEPASACMPRLEALADQRVGVVQAGWGTENGTFELHDPGQIGASAHAGKARTGEVETCRLVDAAEWVAEHLTEGDEVWLKLNCEGFECDIVDRLIDTGQIAKVDHLMIDFDLEKVPGLAYRAAETRRRLDAASTSYAEPRQVMHGRSHGDRIANWLRWTEASGLARARYEWVNRVMYRARQTAYRVRRGR